MVASLWGMRSVDDLDFSLYFPYSFVPLISLNFLPCLYISSTLLGAAGPSFFWGLVIVFNFV